MIFLSGKRGGGRWSSLSERVHSFAASPDPLAQTSNWVALALGSHLPFWPLYVLWAAGWQAWPSCLLTVALAPCFLVVPILCRRSTVLGRVATLAFGILNTILINWVLGAASGTIVFLFPCAALAALLFRKSERWLMLCLALLPLLVWYVLQKYPVTPLHRYDNAANYSLVVLNVFSIGAVVALFGWFQVDAYSRMENHK